MLISSRNVPAAESQPDYDVHSTMKRPQSNVKDVQKTLNKRYVLARVEQTNRSTK